MPRTMISLAAYAALTLAAAAQTTSPSAPAPTDQPTPPHTQPAGGNAAESKPAGSPPSQTASDTKTGSGDTANQETYKMKNGQMYQPPKERPASPAQDLSVYGRT